MNPDKATNDKDFTPQVWPGNPSLNLVCSCKLFRNPFTGKKTPVFIYGGTKEHRSFSYFVSAGANSDYSYSGGIPNDIYELHKAEAHVNMLAETHQLFR